MQNDDTGASHTSPESQAGLPARQRAPTLAPSTTHLPEIQCEASGHPTLTPHEPSLEKGSQPLSVQPRPGSHCGEVSRHPPP
jgi:hypothetical protein